MVTIIQAILIILLVVLLFNLINLMLFGEHFHFPEPDSSEYVPQNMSITEFKEINKYDYPSYLNQSECFSAPKFLGVQRGKKAERFDQIYPGGRETVSCADDSYMDFDGVCTAFGPYVERKLD